MNREEIAKGLVKLTHYGFEWGEIGEDNQREWLRIAQYVERLILEARLDEWRYVRNSNPTERINDLSAQLERLQ